MNLAAMINEMNSDELVLLTRGLLIAEGYLTADEIPPVDTDGYRPATDEFIDGIVYDGRKPIQYLNSHKIGNKDLEELASR